MAEVSLYFRCSLSCPGGLESSIRLLADFALNAFHVVVLLFHL